MTPVSGPTTLEVADVIRLYGPQYVQAFENEMLPSHVRVFDDLTNCRTGALGEYRTVCTSCGHETDAFRSCKSRHCPKCHKNDTKDWVAKRQKDVLPVTYFHVVFTLPHELSRLVYRFQKVLYSVLMKAAALSLQTLARDPRYLGGSIGILAVLHTWTNALAYHPHVHCLVPAGGITTQGEWRTSRPTYLVPVHALSPIFRAIFVKLARKALPGLCLPASIWKKAWVTFSKPCVQGAETVLDYLGRYIYRTAITNSRIIAIHDGNVTFRYKDSLRHRWRTMTLTALEFLRRFLRHVLPRGFHKVRYYGLLSPAHRLDLRTLQLTLPQQHPPEPSCKAPTSDTSRVIPNAICLCPSCLVGYLVPRFPFPTRRRGPPS